MTGVKLFVLKALENSEVWLITKPVEYKSVEMDYRRESGVHMMIFTKSILNRFKVYVPQRSPLHYHQDN